MAASIYTLLNNANATGPWVDFPGGKGVFVVQSGTFPATNVQLEWSPDGGTTALPVDRVGDTFTTLTAVGSGLFELPPCVIRAKVNGAGAANLVATAQAVPD